MPDTAITMPYSGPLARYSFLGFLISSTGVAHYAVIFRNLKVKENAVVMLVALTVSGLVGVWMAWQGMAYWGIATQSIVYVCCVTALRWYYSGWRPTCRVDFRPLRGMIAFSSRLLVTQLQPAERRVGTLLYGARSGILQPKQ